jgi:hypothetical protein
MQPKQTRKLLEKMNDWKKQKDIKLYPNYFSFRVEDIAKQSMLKTYYSMYLRYEIYYSVSRPSTPTQYPSPSPADSICRGR